MNAGDTFYLKRGAADRHLHVIISDPEKFPDQVVFVTMTSFDISKEKVCLIRAGEHPRVKNLTCVVYNEERVKSCSAAELERLAQGAAITWDTPVSEELLSRIREGASLSKDISPEHLDILLHQGVLD